MATGEFHVMKVPAEQLTGALHGQVVDPGAQPTKVVRRSEGWTVDVSWEVTGELVDWLTGCWKLEIIADGAGDGGSRHPSPPMELTFTPGSGRYTASVPMRGRLSPGTYDLVVNLTTATAAGTAGALGGFVVLSKIVVLD
ncbi:hypothetical protein FE391_14825 [Nonomuraea sp. KC401]|uniref:hypothetical protein n=1 Tax=unclassified Nonomuraea TaxID=2593643 RepID=UPI0010FF3078|nr:MULTISPECIES: hypothetical protein [unclassified Nonomuraea]NBE99626.1 hypothetical protein [Nonomuraea sp. K271]TLF73874.1 hypothetical protein FE391_14825 [Nonomuraea sp. KC401]